MDSRTATAQRTAVDLVPGAVRWLEAWLAIPSVSGSAANRGDVVAAAQFVTHRLRGFASEVDLVPTPHGPAVVARIRGRDAHRPSTVVYGHLDVRPAGSGWRSAPFAPARHGSRLIARGASDDKGQLLIHLVAIEAWARAGGPPGDVMVVIDPAEEQGSPGLGRVLRHPLLDRRVGAIVVSDTRQGAPGVPSLTVSQRGALTLSVVVDAGGPAVHAGRFGGAVRDPSVVLAASVRDAICVVERIPADPSLVPSTDAAMRKQAGRAVRSGDLSARATTRASLAVTSLRAGGTPGAIPRSARAEIDVRLPPSVPPGAVRERLIAAFRRRARPPLTVRVHASAGSRGFIARHRPETLDAVFRACVSGFGRPPMQVASGGSIPAVVELERAYGCSPILLGFGPVDDGAHGPNEYLDIADFGRAVQTAVVLFGRLGSTPGSGASESLFQSTEFC